MSAQLLDDIMKLSINERIELVENIWDSIAETPKDIALTDWQCEELDRCLEAHLKDPDEGVAWEDLRGRLLNRI